MKVIDTHAHVLKDSYKEELNDVILKLKENNILSFNISYDIDSSKEVLKLSRKYNHLFPVVGIHPGNIKNYNRETIDELESLITKDVVALGEIGLDYHYENYDKKIQKDFFIWQIELAKKHNLPIVVHTRDSLDDCFDIIKNYPDQKFLLHSWSGTVEETKKFLTISNNIFFSYNGIITFKNAQLQNEVINSIPKDRIVFETDCPYLSPVPFRGKTNYPWRVKEVLEYCSEKMDLNFKEINNLNKKNILLFYKIKKELLD